MTETAIKANEREAARMFERGVAAARGGQRRVAAVLLARAVQLDPQHEMGWLWLSGVIDDPKEIAFCLRSALALNPENERARRGLAWLEQRQLVTPPAPAAVGAAPAASAPEADPEDAVAWRRLLAAGKEGIRRAAAREDEHQAVYHGESWWVNWRRSRRAMGRARLVLLSVPVLLLLLTLALNSFMRGAMERNTALAQAAAAQVAPPEPTPAATPTPPEMLEGELALASDAQVLAYLSALEQPRRQLHDAVQSYRNATNQPGGSSTAHAAAARRLREQVDAAYATLDALSPPPQLATAHAEYLSGLEKERAALDEMLSFYGSFRVELANRAALHMEDASAHLERARGGFAEQLAAVQAPGVAVQTAR